MMAAPGSIRITDVSPRDGLQNEPGAIATTDKARLVRLVSAAGVDEVEVGSFVSPRWVPQLADTPELLAQLASSTTTGSPTGEGVHGDRPTFTALVPNEKGLQGAWAAIDCGLPLDKIAVFTAASETFSRKNTNATIDETLERFVPVINAARQRRVPVRGYISCVVACPFEGRIEPSAVVRVAERLLELGVDELDIGDTIGHADSDSITAVVRPLLDLLRGSAGVMLTLHLHDTFGRAADCVRTALELGVRSFDGSVAGLGGCPYASTPTQRAPGNISTELLVRTIHAVGGRTTVDEGRLELAAEFARTVVTTSRKQPQAGTATGHSA